MNNPLKSFGTKTSAQAKTYTQCYTIKSLTKLASKNNQNIYMSQISQIQKTQQKTGLEILVLTCPKGFFFSGSPCCLISSFKGTSRLQICMSTPKIEQFATSIASDYDDPTFHCDQSNNSDELRTQEHLSSMPRHCTNAREATPGRLLLAPSPAIWT